MPLSAYGTFQERYCRTPRVPKTNTVTENIAQSHAFALHSVFPRSGNDPCVQCHDLMAQNDIKQTRSRGSTSHLRLSGVPVRASNPRGASRTSGAKLIASS